ncbi:MAG TPA: CsgG/HfaB family protein [Candidatus Sulfotelmatobacter sp.]|nr:CsgG/HfaB family protein [Candidatus Sulfotelmatobacter sp.]
MLFSRFNRITVSLFAFAWMCIPASAQTATPSTSATAPAPAPSGPKKRVAVLNFDYGTVKTEVIQLFGSDQDVGKGISDLLVQKLVQDGQFSVIERNAIDKVLAEQNFSNSDRADANTAAKIGKVLGVDAIITGSITQFGRDDKHTNVGGGGHSNPWTGGFGKLGISKSKAIVNVSARIIDANTGEILAAVTGSGESERNGTSIGGGGGDWWRGGGGGLDMGSSNFGATIIGEATHKAVDDTGAQLDAAANKVPTVKIQVNGVVADVSGNTLILNVGKKAGVKVGDKLTISRQVRVVKDPTTGKVIKSVEDTIGDATVTEVDDDSSTATFSGAGAPKVGDVAKN